MLTKSAKASVAMMCISLVLVFLLCFGFSWRRRDGESELPLQLMQRYVRPPVWLTHNELQEHLVQQVAFKTMLTEYTVITAQ